MKLIKKVAEVNETVKTVKPTKYSLYKENQFVKSFDNKEDAVREAKVLGVRVEEE
jgi:hypothetical protein